MKIKTKEVRGVVRLLDDIVEKYKEDHPQKKRDWRTYEQRLAKRLRTAFQELRPLVIEACKTLNTVRAEKRGQKPILSLEQRVLLLLLKHLVGKSNRTMSVMVMVFSLLTDVSVSYKTVERLYSDQEVLMALHNLHCLLLKKQEVDEADCGGDGTGYALTVKKHYATEAQKLKDKLKNVLTTKHKKRLFIYSFEIMDIKTRMYIGYGTCFKSESSAFKSALAMVKESSVKIKSLRLDRYFSAQAYVTLIHEYLGPVILYFIPKKDATVKGPWDWKRMLYHFVNDTEGYLEEYYQRNQSESGFSEDKRRLGWKLGQKREDRIDTSQFLTHIWHNLFWVGG